MSGGVHGEADDGNSREKEHARGKNASVAVQRQRSTQQNILRQSRPAKVLVAETPPLHIQARFHTAACMPALALAQVGHHDGHPVPRQKQMTAAVHQRTHRACLGACKDTTMGEVNGGAGGSPDRMFWRSARIISHSCEDYATLPAGRLGRSVGQASKVHSSRPWSNFHFATDDEASNTY